MVDAAGLIGWWRRWRSRAGRTGFVSLLSREAADELGLGPGMLAVAAVKATSVSVEIPASGSVMHGSAWS